MITEDPRSYSKWKLEVEPRDTNQASFRRFGDDLVELLMFAATHHHEVGPVFRLDLWEWDSQLGKVKQLGPAKEPVPEGLSAYDKAIASQPTDDAPEEAAVPTLRDA